jgi:hypothetical protein
MRTLKLVSLVVLAIALRAGAASAQVCLGLPSFQGGSVHLNVAAEFPDSATAFAVGIGAGRHNSLFANLGGGQVTYEGLDEKSTLGFLEFGFQFPVGKLQLCPIAGGTFGAGPDDDLGGVKVTSSSAAAGLSLGLPLSVGMLRLIPNAGVKYEYLSVKVEDASGKFTENFTGGVLDLGLAFVISDRFSIQPLAHIPFGGEDDDEPSFGVFASVSFGWKSR